MSDPKAENSEEQKATSKYELSHSLHHAMMADDAKELQVGALAAVVKAIARHYGLSKAQVKTMGKQVSPQMVVQQQPRVKAKQAKKPKAEDPRLKQLREDTKYPQDQRGPGSAYALAIRSLRATVKAEKKSSANPSSSEPG